MLKFVNLLKLINSPYQDFWLRLGVALFAGHLIVSHGYGFIKVLTAPGYLLSLAASALIAFVLFLFVNLVTVQLDHYLPWHKSLRARMICQTFLGILLIVALAYGLAEQLFIYMEQKIEESDYMTYDFYFICLYVVLMNGYYYVYYRLKQKKLIKAELAHYKNYHRNYAIKNAPANLAEVDLVALGVERSTIACICRIAGDLRVYDMKGKYTIATTTLGSILQQLPKADYLTLNRFCVVHRLLILNWQDASSRRVAVIFRAPFNSLMPDKRKEVSQGLTESFLAAFNA